MNRTIGMSVFLLLVMAGSTLQAQIVRVGPFGGVRIRAPFFAMDVPGPPVPPPFYAGPRPVVVPPYPFTVRGYPYPYPTVPSVQVEIQAPGFVPSAAAESTMRSAARPNWTPPTNTAELERQLWDAASRLSKSLSVQRDGEIWSNYLAPNRIVAAIEQRNIASLKPLTDHYDGVAANQQLAWLTRLDGFAQTRSLLHQYVAPNSGQQVDAPQAKQQPQARQQPQADAADPVDPPSAGEPEPAPLPLPLPVPDPQPVPDPFPVDDPPAQKAPTPAVPIKPADQG